jgi:hypothetical protein
MSSPCCCSQQDIERRFQAPVPQIQVSSCDLDAERALDGEGAVNVGDRVAGHVVYSEYVKVEETANPPGTGETRTRCA